MRFTVAASIGEVSRTADAMALVQADEQDEGYLTHYDLYYFDETLTPFTIGKVKIGQVGMVRGPTYFRPPVPVQFERLNDDFFSVGQDESYYLNLKLYLEDGDPDGGGRMDEVLRSLNDVALDRSRFARRQSEPVMRDSLLRDITARTVRNQFHRLALGGERLTDYSFTYQFPSSGPLLAFDVRHGSKPPTNVHVLIGSNGVGKSRLLNDIATALLAPEDSLEANPVRFRVVDGEPGSADISTFANLVSVAFSAFDDFEPLSGPGGEIDYAYVGLKKPAQAHESGGVRLKDGSDLADEFALSVSRCVRGARRGRWRRALEELEGDSIFASARVEELAEQAEDPQRAARELFTGQRLSSGHKAVLLTITKLVECVEEQTLVLLDEPETHLHPPLLAAFMRALSDLLIHRNGVAIVATHSPVVLQEVPRKCVTILDRSGDVVVADQPRTETFGEDVGTLTAEVFGLEIERSGFHRLLAQSVDENQTYDDVMNEFGRDLGAEARALVRTLLTMRSRGY